MKIDWKRKLTSRKFWAAVIGFVTQLMLASGASEGTVTQTVAVVMAGATLIAYMLAEGFADSGDHTIGGEDPVQTIAIGFEHPDTGDNDSTDE